MSKHNKCYLIVYFYYSGFMTYVNFLSNKILSTICVYIIICIYVYCKITCVTGYLALVNASLIIVLLT